MVDKAKHFDSCHGAKNGCDIGNPLLDCLHPTSSRRANIPGHECRHNVSSRKVWLKCIGGCLTSLEGRADDVD